MVNIKKVKGTIGILTGGGDVPGLNPAIRAITIRALREGYQVIGLRRGWGGLLELIRDKKADNSNKYFTLTEEIVNKAGRTGGTFLHTPSYAVRMYQEGVKVIAIPKTMDNDVPGTDYCIGFSTCVTRTIGLCNTLRTSAGSHERILVIEVFGRYAGFTALLPTMAGAANRGVIPEYKVNIDRLTELLVAGRETNPR